MVVRTTEGESVNLKIFELRSGSMLGDLFKDYVKSLKLYPIDMENVRESVLPTFIYAAFLSVKIFIGLCMASLINIGEFMFRRNIVLSIGAFCAMPLFFFIASYVYRNVLGKRLDTSYISYVYVVALSMTYYPPFMFIWMIIWDCRLADLLMLVMALISQFFINFSISRDHSFNSTRESFIFSITVFLFQFGFVIISFRLFHLFSPPK